MSRLMKLRGIRDSLAKEVFRCTFPGPGEDDQDLANRIEDIVCLKDGCGHACNWLRRRTDPLDVPHVDKVRQLAKASACVAYLEARQVPVKLWWHTDRIKTLREHSKRWVTQAAIGSVIEAGRFR